MRHKLYKVKPYRTLPRYVGRNSGVHTYRTNTSDLEQPAYRTYPLCTDINTPEEDNTWDESKTQRLRIGRHNSQQISKQKHKYSETKH